MKWRRTHNYISLFVDLDNNKVLYACEGKDANVINSFREDLIAHNGIADNIEMFCSDMSPAFISGITEQFPNSSITFDRFHVMMMVNEAIDQVRRKEQLRNKNLKKQGTSGLRTRAISQLWKKRSWDLSET